MAVELGRVNRAVRGEPDAHGIDGVGAGFVVPLWQNGLADRIERVSTVEATAMALRLAREEGQFAGTSPGGHVARALRVAEELGPDVTVVTLMRDTGMRYLGRCRAGLDGLTVIAAGLAAGASRSRVKDCMTEGDPDAGESREAGVTAPPG